LGNTVVTIPSGYRSASQAAKDLGMGIQRLAKIMDEQGFTVFALPRNKRIRLISDETFEAIEAYLNTPVEVN
jgi:hypothetical protein